MTHTTREVNESLKVTVISMKRTCGRRTQRSAVGLRRASLRWIGGETEVHLRFRRIFHQPGGKAEERKFHWTVNHYSKPYRKAAKTILCERKSNALRVPHTQEGTFCKVKENELVMWACSYEEMYPGHERNKVYSTKLKCKWRARKSTRNPFWRYPGRVQSRGPLPNEITGSNGTTRAW